MSKKRHQDVRHRGRSINGAIYLKPGLYQLAIDLDNAYVPSGFWATGTRFVVERYVEKIGEQAPFEFLTIRLAKVDKVLLTTYRASQWNVLATMLSPVKDDIEDFIVHGDVPPLHVLNQLEQSGRLSREDIWHAIEKQKQLVE